MWFHIERHSEEQDHRVTYSTCSDSGTRSPVICRNWCLLTTCFLISLHIFFFIFSSFTLRVHSIMGDLGWFILRLFHGRQDVFPLPSGGFSLCVFLQFHDNLPRHNFFFFLVKDPSFLLYCLGFHVSASLTHLYPSYPSRVARQGHELEPMWDAGAWRCRISLLSHAAGLTMRGSSPSGLTACQWLAKDRWLVASTWGRALPVHFLILKSTPSAAHSLLSEDTQKIKMAQSSWAFLCCMYDARHCPWQAPSPATTWPREIPASRHPNAYTGGLHGHMWASCLPECSWGTLRAPRL